MDINEISKSKFILKDQHQVKQRNKILKKLVSATEDGSLKRPSMTHIMKQMLGVKNVRLN